MRAATRITIDIETVPDLRLGALEAAASRVKVPGNYSKPESIAKYVEENKDEAYRRTALDGGYGQLLMVGVAFDDDTPTVLRRSDLSQDAEIALLHAAFQQFEERARSGTIWVGHNVFFDLKFLYHRAVIHRVPISSYFPIHPKPWDDRIFDTSYMWTGDSNRGIKLSELTSILGIDAHDDDLDGSKVWDAVQAGEFDRIANYCAADVVTTRLVAARMGLGALGEE